MDTNERATATAAVVAARLALLTGTGPAATDRHELTDWLLAGGGTLTADGLSSNAHPATRVAAALDDHDDQALAVALNDLRTVAADDAWSVVRRLTLALPGNPQPTSWQYAWRKRVLPVADAALSDAFGADRGTVLTRSLALAGAARNAHQASNAAGDLATVAAAFGDDALAVDLTDLAASLLVVSAAASASTSLVVSVAR